MHKGLRFRSQWVYFLTLLVLTLLLFERIGLWAAIVMLLFLGAWLWAFTKDMQELIRQVTRK